MSALAPVLRAGGQWLSELLEQTEQRLQAIATRHRPPVSSHVASTLSAGGKRLRPILVFLSAGDGPRRQAIVRAGAAVELLHMATLVHDDVLDRATLRRGRATVYSNAGREAATASGDLLFSCAFAELVATQSPEAVRVLSWASAGLARGELMQRSDAWSTAVTLRRYMERCELKTGRLFEAACRLGAIFGAPTQSLSDALGRFGSRLGLAFQIFDDVLDVTGSADHTGKHRGTDLLDGTVTLPLLLALNSGASHGELDIRSVRGNSQRARKLCDRIAATGALEQARRRARGYLDEAKEVLERSGLPQEHRSRLELVCDQLESQYA